MRNRWAGGAIVLALAAAGCSRATSAGQPASSPAPQAGNATPASSPPSPGAVTPAPSAAAPAATTPSAPLTSAEVEALYRARADSARMRYTAADVQFMSGMIHHHAQAIVMSRMAPTHGASASIQTLCSRIINSQNDEIRTMQQWLRDRDQPVPEVHDMGGQLMVMGGGQGMTMMPGMLTPEQLEQLDHARGPEFDRLFLTDMIQHHTGAISMVRDLFATPGAAQGELAFKLASDIQVDQTTEIARMERMLAAMRFSGGGK